MSDGGIFVDWVADNELDLIDEWTRDGGKNVHLYIVSALIDHYGGWLQYPTTWVGLINELITRDKELEALYLKYVEARWQELNDRSMVLYDREREV